jgi:hypothetical protein
MQLRLLLDRGSCFPSRCGARGRSAGDEREALAARRVGKAIVEAYEADGRGIALGGDDRGCELERVCRPEWMRPHDASREIAHPLGGVDLEPLGPQRIAISI